MSYSIRIYLAISSFLFLATIVMADDKSDRFNPHLPPNLDSVEPSRIADAIELSVLVSGMQSELPDRDVVWVRMFVNNRGATTSLKAVHWTLKNLWLEDVAEVVAAMNIENVERQVDSSVGSWYYQPVVFNLYINDPDVPTQEERQNNNKISTPKTATVIVETVPIHLEESVFSSGPNEYSYKDTTSLYVWVTKDGKVAATNLAHSSGNEFLDSAAFSIAPKNRFTPTFVNGEAKSGWVTYQVTFKNRNDTTRTISVFNSSIIDSPSLDAMSSMDDYLPSQNEFVPVEIMPEMIKEFPPDYPASAKKARKGGTVWIKVLVRKDGEVSNATIARTSGIKTLDDAALKVATKNLFNPGIQGGKPVAVWVTYKVDFVIR